MLYKEDWEIAQERLLAWWEQEIVDRVCIQVTAPRAGVTRREIPVPETLEQRWTDLDYVVESQGELIRCTYYGGEAFPLFNPNLGPDIFAAFLGAPIHFAEDTSWVDPIITDWRQRPALALDADSPWWRMQMDLLARAHEAGRGRWITGIPDTHSGGDALSALRGRQQLCIDLVDNAGDVQAAMRELEPVVIDVYERYFPVIEYQQYGFSSGWLPVWSTGRANVIQCDFIALISPVMFERHFLDELALQARWLDRTIYHLDGTDCIRHLDLLFTIPEIRAIQWVPGAGAPPMPHWIPLLRRIQKAGRGLHLQTEPEHVETLLRELSPRGLLLNTHVDSEEEADDLIRHVARWTTDR
jgi:hypothetical protein